MIDFPFDYIYSSPLKRALKTAAAANVHMRKDICTDSDLREINAGIIEGMKYADMPRLCPKDAENWHLYPHLFYPPNGESMKSVYKRTWDAILRIARGHKYKRTCVVSHGCAIRNILCNAKGWEIEKLNDVDWCDNTAISLIQFDEDFNPEIVFENDASHLTDDISTFATQSWWKKESRGKIVTE
jgi:probable phosphoglycerate mutase